LRASRSAFALLLLGMTMLIGPSSAGAVGPVVPGDWPPIKLGIWKIDTTRILPNGKTRRSGGSGPVCGDASTTFLGYWGRGIVEMAGCRYTATRVADERFKIVTECIVRGLAKPSHAETEVTMHGPEAFEMKGTIREGKKTYRVTQVGRRLSDCPSRPQP
jgi:hypothetical protein